MDNNSLTVDDILGPEPSAPATASASANETLTVDDILGPAPEPEGDTEIELNASMTGAHIFPLIGHVIQNAALATGEALIKNAAKTGKAPTLFGLMSQVPGEMFEGGQAAIKGGAQLDANMIAPFVSPAGMAKLEAAGLYDNSGPSARPDMTTDQKKSAIAQDLLKSPSGVFASILLQDGGLNAPLAPLFDIAGETAVKSGAGRGNVDLTMAALTLAGVAAHGGVKGDIADAGSAHVLSPEAVYMGERPPTPQEAQTAHLSAQVAPSAQITPEPIPSPDIHQMARNIAPEVFTQYDALQTRKDNYRQFLNDLGDKQMEDASANAPYTEEIQSLQDKLADANPRKAKIYQARVDELTDINNQHIAEVTAEDSPDMARVRDELQKTDYKMRDLAPEVTRAYKSAQEFMPEEMPEVSDMSEPHGDTPTIGSAEKPASTSYKDFESGMTPQKYVDDYIAGKGRNDPNYEQFAANHTGDIESEFTGRLAQEGKPAESAGKPQATGQDAQQSAIVQDMTQKLIQNGRPAEEAAAAAQLVAARYKTLSENFQGKKGSSLDLYKQEGALIRTARAKSSAPNTSVKGRELAQPARGKIRLATEDAKATITLMKTANASTFMHETGHQWLEELMHYSGDAEAPKQMKDDASAVRQWMGLKEGEAIPTKQHEKFARGFERYLMEGIAPSSKLKAVFEKFRDWLHQIYSTVDRLKSPITDDIRDVFARLIETSPEKRTADGKTEPGSALADIHEADASLASPAHAEPLAEQIRSEVDKTANLHNPEVHDEITSLSETGGNAVAPAEAGSNGIVGQSTGEGAVASPSQAVNSGGGEASQNGSRVSPNSAYLKTPRRPLDLAGFVRKEGGVKDIGGDIRSALDKGAKGIIRPKAGKTLDDMAMRAWEEGYFPELSRRPTVNEFLDKLNESATGAAEHFSSNDTDTATAYKTALEHNDHVDQLASKYNIDAKGMNHDQFWDAVAHHMSEEEQVSRAEAYESDAKAEETRLKALEKEFLDSRGDAWEPPAVEKTRSLEDLENAYQQETDAREPQQGNPVSGGSEGAGESANAGQGGEGQRGSSTESGRRNAKTDSGEAAAGPGDAGSGSSESSGTIPRRGGSKSDVVDKAGNIRLDLLNTPEDVNEQIRQMAESNGGFISDRRGVVSNGQTLDLAASMGLQPWQVNMRKVGEARNAEEIVAYTKLMIDAARSAGEAAKSGDVAAYVEARERQKMMQAQVAGVTAEAGRALQIFQALKKMDGYNEAKAMTEFLKQNDNGKTLFQLEEEMKYAARLSEPEQLSLFIENSKKPQFKKMILEYYINALISGPITHFRYAVGNAVNALWAPLVETPIAAALGALRGDADRVYLGETGAQLYGLMKGSRDGISAAVEAFKTGVSPALPGERASSAAPFDVTHAIPGKVGVAINVPSKSVAAIHSFFKSMRYEQNLQALAYRQAMKEGLSGDDFTNRIADITTHPMPDIVESATKDALKELYMSPTDYHSTMGSINRAVNNSLPLKIMIPFMKIGTQITRNAFVERTPLGMFSKEIRANLSGANGGAARDYQSAKMTAGIALMGVTAMAAIEGNVTGDGPEEPRARAAWLLDHHPNSIKIGGITVPFQGLGSLGMLMRFSANMVQTAQHWTDEDGHHLAVSALEGLSKSVLDENFMRGVKDALDAIYHPNEYGARYVDSMATNWLPWSVGLSQVARATDPFSREAHSILDAARAKIPGLSETLMPRRDMFGEPIGPAATFNKYKTDPVVARLQALNIGISKPERKINGVALTDQQYDDYSRIAGKMTKMALNNMITTEFGLMPPGVQVREIQKVSEKMKEAAASMVKFNPANVNIIKTATANKMNLLKQPAH